MGGFGSGRSGCRATIEDGLTLSLSNLLRDGLFQPGVMLGGSIVWTGSKSGERAGSIGYEALLGQESGRLRLKYTTARWGEERRETDYWIQLTTTAQPFGGRRWWFVCPRTGKRAEKLYLPGGASTFASRQAHRLAYRSQRETSYDRALRRAFKLRARLGGHGGIGNYTSKPKWMRWPTYERKVEQIAAAEEAVDARLADFIRNLERRFVGGTGLGGSDRVRRSRSLRPA